MSLLAGGFNSDETEEERQEADKCIAWWKEQLVNFICWEKKYGDSLVVSFIRGFCGCQVAHHLIDFEQLPEPFELVVLLLFGVVSEVIFFCVRTALRWLAVYLTGYVDPLLPSTELKEESTEEEDNPPDPELRAQRISKPFIVSTSRKLKTM